SQFEGGTFLFACLTVGAGTFPDTTLQVDLGIAGHESVPASGGPASLALLVPTRAPTAAPWTAILAIGLTGSAAVPIPGILGCAARDRSGDPRDVAAGDRAAGGWRRRVGPPDADPAAGFGHPHARSV